MKMKFLKQSDSKIEQKGTLIDMKINERFLGILEAMNTKIEDKLSAKQKMYPYILE